MYESGELHEALGVEPPAGADPGPGETADPGSAPLGIENRLG